VNARFHFGSIILAGQMTVENAIRVLRDAAAGLDLVKDDQLEYSQWRQSNVRKLDSALLETDPFNCLRSAWLFTGDGGGLILGLRCGEWAANQLLSGNSPEDIVSNAQSELARNTSDLFDISPIFGAKLEQEIVLQDGIRLIPAEQVPQEWHTFNVMTNFVSSPFDPRDCCVLRQDMTVSPAFAARTSISERVTVKSVTVPTDDERRAIRARVRAAMLLSCSSAIELPVTTRLASRNQLLVFQGSKSGSLTTGMLPFAKTVDENCFKRNFAALGSFRNSDALVRAIDRLGRARFGNNPGDAALDLGIAAEVLLMHGTSNSNTEIAYKLATRAAWLTGRSVADRASAFEAARELYKARSDAVHNGKLSSRTTFDQERGDELVRSAIEAVLLKGDFPNWDKLILGADLEGNNTH
jgi:hypothetical protein